MATIFSHKERARHLSWQAGYYFACSGMLTRVVLGERDWRVLRSLFENKIVSREQIGSQFFPDVSRDTVNKRLRKLVDIGLVRRKSIYEGRRLIMGYYLTQRGLAKTKPSLPYEIETKTTRSERPLHDIALNDIRKAFEAKDTVQGYCTKNVLQTRTDFRNNSWLTPFIDLHCAAMVEIDSKDGTLNLAIEFNMTHKSKRGYRRKLNAYHRHSLRSWGLACRFLAPNIDEVLYICANEDILQTLLRLDGEMAERHHGRPKLYFALLESVTSGDSEMTFTNTSGDVFCVR